MATTSFICWLLAFILVALASRKGKRRNSYIRKREEPPKITIEDMCSQNNKLSLFFKSGDTYAIFVSNEVVGKEEFVFADNLEELKVKVIKLLKKYAAIERVKSEET